MSDLIFSNVGDDKIIAGYMIPNTLNAVTTYNGMYEENKPQCGGNVSLVSDLFKGLAVPAGLFLMQQSVSKKPVTDGINIVKHNTIDTDLYDKLLDLVSVKDKKLFNNKTRKNKKQNNKTRKSR